ncbi:hypothetical protein KQH65_06635 [archaeon]|nr:hypothetical protein [archaeon]
MLGERLDDVIHRGLPYLINTLFDAVFTILGIVVGSSFSSVLDTRSIIGTMITASISLGVSSGFSVYEAETIQEEKRISKIEEAMITKLGETVQTQESKIVTILSSALVFFTPIIACIVTLAPFLFVFLGFISVNTSLRLAVLIDLGLIFSTGLVFGGEKRLLKGIRMTVLGGMIFLLGFLMETFF